MTSASELFNNRRHRFGLRNSAVDVGGFDSSPADANSTVSQHHRTTNRRHHHYSGSLSNRRENRHDLDGCEPPLRRIHRHRLDQSEHEQVHPEQGGNQSPTSSIINSEDFRSIRRRRPTGNDRLPGAVLLARERLLERLRGVSISGNRQSNRPSPNNPLEFNREWVEEIAESWQAVMPISRSLSQEETRKRPPGLDQNTLNLLPLELFEISSSASRECTICLEGLENGDEVIRLSCEHGFHSCCLLPWLRVCGACPNCRKVIVVTHDKPDTL